MAITITLTPDEQRAFLQLIDVALRHSGTGALNVAAHFQTKLAEAQREAARSRDEPVSPNVVSMKAAGE